jgi:hypothetical protein
MPAIKLKSKKAQKNAQTKILKFLDSFLAIGFLGAFV